MTATPRASHDDACSAGRSIILLSRGRSLSRSRFRSRYSARDGGGYVSAQPASRQGPPAPDPPLRELRGVVERITFQNPDNGYTVARLAPERADAEAEVARGDDRLVTVVGTLADLTPGEAIVAHGWWRNDPKHGWQFQATDYRTALPATLQGMKKYLGSGLVKGVGPINAGRIVDAFGEATFEVIDADPHRLTEVPGIGPVRAGRIAATWAEQRHIREVMAALQGYGISTSLAVRIYKRFGGDSGRVISHEPSCWLHHRCNGSWGTEVLPPSCRARIGRSVLTVATTPERVRPLTSVQNCSQAQRVVVSVTARPQGLVAPASYARISVICIGTMGDSCYASHHVSPGLYIWEVRPLRVLARSDRY